MALFSKRCAVSFQKKDPMQCPVVIAGRGVVRSDISYASWPFGKITLHKTKMELSMPGEKLSLSYKDCKYLELKGGCIVIRHRSGRAPKHVWVSGLFGGGLFGELQAAAKKHGLGLKFKK
jgi:hypothetical protein